MAGLTWSDQETYELIRIWAADRDLLDGTSRNNKVYESMAAQMRSLGYMRTALQVKEKMKRLRKEYKYGKRSKKIATYHDALATVLSGGGGRALLAIKNEVDESMGSEEYAGTDTEASYLDEGGLQSTPGHHGSTTGSVHGDGSSDDRTSGGMFSSFRTAVVGGALEYTGRPATGSPLECASAPSLHRGGFQPAFADNFPTITTTTVEPENASRCRVPLKRKLSSALPLSAEGCPGSMASTMTDLITRGIDKFVELEHKRMRMELEMLERLRLEELERLERMRREEMDHELRLMTLLASIGGNNVGNVASTNNVNSVHSSGSPSEAS
ncbi:uncharacterized protein LOC135368051 [Ornithodoros turicata]